MAAFFVTGSGTDIGKTWLCTGLLSLWRLRGLDPDALKPVLTGFDPVAPQGSDSALLLEALGRVVDPAALAAMTPFRFAAPLSPDQAAGLENRILAADAIADACGPVLAVARGPVLIEAAGGVMSPLNAHETMLDLAVALDLPAVFVAGTYLGALSHALTGLAALKARGVTVAALALVESLDSVGLAQTAASLSGHCPDLPIAPLVRGASVPALAKLSAILGV